MRISRSKFNEMLISRDMTSKELSKRSGISVQTISAIRRGKSCRAETGQKIASAFGINVSELLEKIR